jgi:phosphatidylglycerophosphate synthase
VGIQENREVNSASATATRRSAWVNVPNLVSALRLPIAAAFFAVDGLLWRGVLLFLGAMSDALDGWLARRFGLESKTGVIIDPLFDKLFVTVVLAAFLAGPDLGWRGFLVLISRDLYVGTGFLLAKALRINVPTQPRRSGKVVTFLQIVTLFVLLLAPERAELFIVAVGVASAIAIVDYTVVGVANLRRRSKTAQAAARFHRRER